MWNPFKKNMQKKSMYDTNTLVERDNSGNIYYLNSMLKDYTGLVIGNKRNKKIDFDLSIDTDKRIALEVCTPFSMVVDKCGKMLSNGKFYVVDKDNSENKQFQWVADLLKQPNVLQTGKQFNKLVEIQLKAFGRCPIYVNRVMGKVISMWIIPPELFHLETTGNLWNQTELSGIIKKAWIDWGGTQLELEEDEYFVVNESNTEICPTNTEMIYKSVCDTLSHPINNWMSQMIARGTLINNGGPKGIICNDDVSEYRNSALDNKEADNLNSKFRDKYGIVNKLFSIWVTKAKVKWIPLSFNTSQLMLHEEDKSCRDSISNLIGLNPSLFDTKSIESNMSNAETSAYQNLIIPDAESYAEALTNHIAPEGCTIKLDYSHIACLQDDKQAASTALSAASNAIIQLYNAGIITDNESRSEISNYIDINPTILDGKLKENGTN